LKKAHKSKTHARQHIANTLRNVAIDVLDHNKQPELELTFQVPFDPDHGQWCLGEITELLDLADEQITSYLTARDQTGDVDDFVVYAVVPVYKGSGETGKIEAYSGRQDIVSTQEHWRSQ